MVPETRYALSGDAHIAYQVTGEGPVDVLVIPGFVSSVELWWEEPEGARFLRGLSAFARVIIFDKRGTGLSDRVPEHALPSLEQRVDDVRAVLDAIGSERAVLLGCSEGAAMSIFFAASHPGRVGALVLFGGSAVYPWGKGTDRQALVDLYCQMIESAWGRGVLLPLFGPSAIGDARLERWGARWERISASPAAAKALIRMLTEIDVRDLLPSVRVPTLVLHRTGDRVVATSAGRYLAKHIPGATYKEHPGCDHLPFLGDSSRIVADIEELVTGARTERDPDHLLATVLFTDIVGSTERAVDVGDRRWRAILDEHDAHARREIERARGRFVKSTGDGVLAVFDGPARAIRCAAAFREAVASLGLDVRAGLHVGDIQLRGHDIGGVAVHAAARIMGDAAAGEILVSSTARDLLAGAGIVLVDRGLRTFKGLPGEWRLFAAAVDQRNGPA